MNSPASIRIGPHTLPNRVFLAPMAGVTDRPFRQLCRHLGAGYAVSEMVASRFDLRTSHQALRRLCHDGETGPIAVQILGTEPAVMAEAARAHIGLGAQIIDINMGCPAKKVCHQWAGSALMQDLDLAIRIVSAVVQACTPHEVPVTLKMRTGYSASHKNAVQLARRAQDAGAAMITVHGRTRDQRYRGQAEYDTVAAVKAAVSVPVVANGDIDTPAKACAVLAATGVDAVMVGRAALGRPWVFRDMVHFMVTGQCLPQPQVADVKQWVLSHLQDHYALYGDYMGVRTARKHIGWYFGLMPGGATLCARLNTLDDGLQQSQAVAAFFDTLADQLDRWPDADALTVVPSRFSSHSHPPVLESLR